jgi:Zn-dependent protease with chaperone function
MAEIGELSFEDFVERRRAARPGAHGDDAHAYAYAADRETRAAFERMKPIELAVAAGVRMFKAFGKAELLGHAVKVGPRQLPRVHALAVECAETLGIATPALYVVSSPVLNAATYGTNDDSFVMVHSALIDHFGDDELRSIIGHECGHIHNSHVVYLTALHTLSQMMGIVVRWAALPAVLALRAWSRRAEITCDRAGALCARDLGVATRALTKLALGSTKLYQELNVEAFLEQHAESQEGFGRYAEVLATHPWLPKRVLALRAFAETALYRERIGGASGGLAMQEVDERVRRLIKVVG